MAEVLKFGLFSMNMDACADPTVAVRVAHAAEAAGFESLWAGEHVVLPDPQVPPSPMAPTDRILDPIVALTFLAAQTSRVRLGTGVIVLPQRQPLVLAKELASLDALSGGRLIVGVGAGYLEPELRALGVPMAERGARTDDYLAAMRAIWTDERPAHDGRFVSFAGVQAHPRRAIPVVVGGHSPAAHRRAVEHAHGWYGFALTPDATAEALNGLRVAAAKYRRPAELGELEISVTPNGAIDRPTAARYAALGVERLILMPPRHLTEDALADFAGGAGAALIARP